MRTACLKLGVFSTFSKCSIFVALLLEKATATVFILGDKVLSPVHLEYKTLTVLLTRDKDLNGVINICTDD